MMPSAPPSEFDEEFDEEARALEYYSQERQQQRQSQRQHQQAFFVTPSPNNSTIMMVDDDEAIACTLQQEEHDAQLARDLEEQIRREEQLWGRSSGIPEGGSREGVGDDDAQYALQVQEQLRDEEVARQFALAEEQALQQQQQQQQQTNVVGQSAQRRRICSRLVVPLSIVVGGVALWWFIVGNNNSSAGGNGIPGFGGGGGGGGIPWLQDNDPFEGLSPGQVPRWRNNPNNGLQLTIINAMQDTWDDVFPLVLKDWDNGRPDTLALTVEHAEEPDPDCESIMGASKVCNGNYGNTRWKGINQVILQNGYIAASTSKMNEYYLAGASTAQRRYTLCHELGHSFGLPHTDENFYNRDLGNCMDYTSNPAVNQQPDESNYLFLKDLYGVLPGGGEEGNFSATTTNGPAPSAREASTEELRNNNNNRRRQLSRQPTTATATTTATTITSSITSAIPDDTIQEKIHWWYDYHDSNSEQLQRQGWRLLHDSQHGQAHELELGNGWSIQMHKLLHHQKE